jgi:hypothetical protein
MSVVSIKRPVINLPKQLRVPGGIPLVEAVTAAEQNLKAAGALYMAVVTGGINEIVAFAATASAAYDEALQAPMYDRARNLIGVASVCGLPSTDEALCSLCDLLDQMKQRQVWDRDAVAVHVNALRLLVAHPGLEGKDGAAAILDGLHQVSRKYKSEDDGTAG